MLPRPYLLFLGDVRGAPLAKTAFGLRDWAPDAVVGQWRLPASDIDLGLEDLDAREAAARGARALVIGVAPIGGAIQPSWIPCLLAALEAGLDIVSGLHSRLEDIGDIRIAAKRFGRTIYEVRRSDQAIPVATGRRRSGKRLLTVGTDCALGKKYTALAIARALKTARVSADFRATGQTGIMIAGKGVAIDAVVADFIAGAAETLSPDADPDHWDIIEGQGALFHPAYAGVTLGLIHGSQPDALVLCHDPDRTTLNGFPHFPVPSLEEAARRYVEAARLTNPDVRLAGVSLNTSTLGRDAAEALMRTVGAEFGVPCFDPLKSDLTPLVERLRAW